MLLVPVTDDAIDNRLEDRSQEIGLPSAPKSMFFYRFLWK